MDLRAEGRGSFRHLLQDGSLALPLVSGSPLISVKSLVEQARDPYGAAETVARTLDPRIWGSEYRESTGLVNPFDNRDACGVASIVDTTGKSSHGILQQALKILANLEHRGATGCDPCTSDGAGILTQKPDSFFRTLNLPFELPSPERYAVASIFMPRDLEKFETARHVFESTLKEFGLSVLGWRDVPTDASQLGWIAKSQEPRTVQLFIQAPSEIDQGDFERKLFVARRIIEKSFAQCETDPGQTGIYINSMSSKSIVYKGLLLTDRIANYFPDLQAKEYETTLAVVHSRFATNTDPRWQFAHPYRRIAHNGEFNTISGNREWMRVREHASAGGAFSSEDWSKLSPLVSQRGSDTASMDNAVELLHLAGISLPHAVTLLMPPAWKGNPYLNEGMRQMFRYHHSMIEPWDGPAAVHMSDGDGIGVRLDRNGLRSQRVTRTRGGLLVVSSEDGVLDIPEQEIVQMERVPTGGMIYFDREKGVRGASEIMEEMARANPYAEAMRNRISLSGLPDPLNSEKSLLPVKSQQLMFGWTQEDKDSIAIPMAVTGQELVSSMGDVHLGIFSDQLCPLYDYFLQLFAQVTNPPIDSIREQHVMDDEVVVGPKGDFLHFSHEHGRGVELPVVLMNRELRQVAELNGETLGLHASTIDITFDVLAPKGALSERIDALCSEIETKIHSGASIIILSDGQVGEARAPIPALLAVSAVHHFLVEKGLRHKASLIVESSEPRETHHIACLVGFGADAVNPRLMFRTIRTELEKVQESGGGDPRGPLREFLQRDREGAIDHLYENTRSGLLKGVKKIMSKMGISPVTSYQGAKLFGAIGLKAEFVERYFPGVSSPIGGLGIEFFEEQQRLLHQRALKSGPLPLGGRFSVVRGGERHAVTREKIELLQRAVRPKDEKAPEKDAKERQALYNAFAAARAPDVNRPLFLRDLFEMKPRPEGPLPLSEIESADDILSRLSTGAMSLGALSSEAHETLAVALNRIRAKIELSESGKARPGPISNSGEGGESKERTRDLTRKSRTRQIASGRFGVDLEYLLAADQIQIKIAQGAKPGEGGQLPGQKVTVEIASIRGTTPGVTLISPPPHHDIYSIEDLKQLIFDLKSVNPRARISVKLVSSQGEEIIANGVAKSEADHIVTSDGNGGTGATPASSSRYAGFPVEIGLAATQQSLVQNLLRADVALEADGQVASARDLATLAMLGADEIGISTWALVAEGCIMLGLCHEGACTEGVATQIRELRGNFKGKPEHVVNYMYFIAEELRGIMAELGFRTFDEMVGRVDRLSQAKTEHWKAKYLDYSRLLDHSHLQDSPVIRHTSSRKFNASLRRDASLVDDAIATIREGRQFVGELRLTNADRAFGTYLAARVFEEFGGELPPDSILFQLTGRAGQSLGAWIPPFVTLRMRGGANDYVGKGLSGGRISIGSPEERATEGAPVLAGNACLYGATAGEVFIGGKVGDRFCVRNSGANGVVRAVGDNAFEYMTGGKFIVLDEFGWNAFAGMSGGEVIVMSFEGMEQRINALSRGTIREYNLSPQDERWVRGWIETYSAETGCERGKEILADWDRNKTQFKRFIPFEYERALKAQHPEKS